MMQLRLVRELSPTRLGEVGRPVGAWRREDGQYVALCSSAGRLYWPGRALYRGQAFTYRMSLYDGALSRRLGVFDRARFPVTDLAFHPSLPIVAIGTGRYDGGYAFEGDLWLWNWETGRSSSVLPESRKVVQVRWSNDGGVEALLSPSHDETDEFELFRGAAACVNGANVEADGFSHDSEPAAPPPQVSADPTTLGFGPAPQSGAALARYLDVVGEAHSERTWVWDLLWLSGERLAAAHDQCFVEVWDTTSGTKIREHTGDGHGVQLLEAMGRPVVNVLRRLGTNPWPRFRSRLYAITSDGLDSLRTFDHPVVLSSDRAGHLLCRDPGDRQRTRTRNDVVLSAGNKVVLRRDLGHYDCFNHYIRLDGGDGLFFLRGTPAASHQGKWLCRVHLDGRVDELRAWDDKHAHLMTSAACWVGENELVRAYVVHDYRPDEGNVLIERTAVRGTSAPPWRRELSAPAVCLSCFGSCVAYGLMDGTIGLLDARTGATVFETPLIVDGVQSIATAIAPNGGTLAVGTIDGRVLIYTREGE